MAAECFSFWFSRWFHFLQTCGTISLNRPIFREAAAWENTVRGMDNGEQQEVRCGITGLALENTKFLADCCIGYLLCWVLNTPWNPSKSRSLSKLAHNVYEKQKQLNAYCLKVWKRRFYFFKFHNSASVAAVSSMNGNTKKSIKRLEAFYSLLDKNWSLDAKNSWLVYDRLKHISFLGQRIIMWTSSRPTNMVLDYNYFSQSSKELLLRLLQDKHLGMMPIWG